MLNTHQMHENSSPVIFDAVGGAVKMGVVDGREVWGSTFALLHCADVALGYCSVVRCSTAVFFLLPLRRAFITFLSLPLFISPRAPSFFFLSFFSRLLVQCFLCVSSVFCLARHHKLAVLYIRSYFISVQEQNFVSVDQAE